MNHRKRGRSLNRTSSHRKAMFENMCISLIKSEDGLILTTVFKAKDLRLYLEPLVTKAKLIDDANKLATVRYLLSKLSNDKEAVAKLIELAKKYTKRPGGYLSVLKYGYRKGDSSPMAYVRFVD